METINSALGFDIHVSDDVFKKDFKRERGEEVEYTDEIDGYTFFGTASHGFLVVSTSDKHANIAKKIQSDGYGYKTKLAYYLEEDCQAGDFLKAIKEV